MKRRLDLIAGLLMGLLLAAPVFLLAAGALAEADTRALPSSSPEQIASPAPEAGEVGEGDLVDEAHPAKP